MSQIQSILGNSKIDLLPVCSHEFARNSLHYNIFFTNIHPSSVYTHQHHIIISLVLMHKNCNRQKKIIIGLFISYRFLQNMLWLQNIMGIYKLQTITMFWDVILYDLVKYVLVCRGTCCIHLLREISSVVKREAECSFRVRYLSASYQNFMSLNTVSLFLTA